MKLVLEAFLMISKQRKKFLQCFWQSQCHCDIYKDRYVLREREKQREKETQREIDMFVLQ